MNLTEKQECVIRKKKLLAYSETEKGGKAYYREDGEEKEFIIPQFGEILQMVFESIKKDGFSQIQRCSPLDANCIIRVYQDLHHECGLGVCINLYGAECYTRVNGVWKTTNDFRETPINWEKHQFRISLMPDESPLINADFADYHVKII